MNRDELGKRMKENYEAPSQMRLIRRTPVIIRIDGKAFHTLTKNFDKPFDSVFGVAMMKTAQALCREISGAQFAYVQSDEISILLQDYATLQTDAWFDYNIQKLASVSASLATMYFNQYFADLVHRQFELDVDTSKYETKDGKWILQGAFDARCFNIPKDEVCNYFIWRQNDCSKNSIQTLSRAFFSHKELQGLSLAELQDKLVLEKHVNWNDLEIWKKRGSCVYRNQDRRWYLDKAMPILTQDRNFVNKWVYIDEIEKDI